VLERALGERKSQGYAEVATEIRPIAGRYIAGEESALIAGLSGGETVPSFRLDKSVPLHLGRLGALVHNAETLANVALIARHGGEWFKAIGAADAPGTCLVSVGGSVTDPGVFEVATGTPIYEILELAMPSYPLQAVLVGGFGGTWIKGELAATPYAPSALRQIGASMGAGIVVAIGNHVCGIRETERIAQFMAFESAGQCGPCLFGLPAIAQDLRAIADGVADRSALARLRERCGIVAGRGACRHPDGVVRLVQSALEVFAGDIASHLHGVPCRGSYLPSALVSFRSATQEVAR
jgi:NADH:ubiquinone oxidoreductase subunit F (NADH-binding)